MTNIVQMNFGHLEFIEFSENLTIDDCAYHTKSLSLEALHKIVLRYRGVGKYLDPTGRKCNAAARLYNLLVQSGDLHIGVSDKFGLECLEDLERL